MVHPPRDLLRLPNYPVLVCLVNFTGDVWWSALYTCESIIFSDWEKLTWNRDFQDCRGPSTIAISLIQTVFRLCIKVVSKRFWRNHRRTSSVNGVLDSLNKYDAPRFLINCPLRVNIFCYTKWNSFDLYRFCKGLRLWLFRIN